MKSNASHLISTLPLVLILFTGCAYKGPLRTGFYTPPACPTKVPLTVNLVFPATMESQSYRAEGVYFSHSVEIATHPALRQAIEQNCESIFTRSFTTATLQNAPTCDVLIYPAVELRDRVLHVTLTAKQPTSGETIQQYQASGNLVCGIPGGVHALGAVNIAFSGLLSPIISPSITSMLGKQHEKMLENRLSSCLAQIASEMQNDRFLVTKAKRVALTTPPISFAPPSAPSSPPNT